MPPRHHAGGRKGESESTKLSKGLSWVLRHGAEQEGIAIDSAGYCRLDDVLKCRRFRRGTNLSQVQQVVADNDKQRFHMKQEGGEWYIRANQGHSMKCVKAEELLVKLDPSFAGAHPFVYHGTYYKAWEAILATGGLSKMTRNSIHFALDVPEGGGAISGMRGNCNLVVRIDLRRPDVWEATEWYQAANGVVLTEGIDGILPLELVENVSERRTGKVIYSND